MKKTSKISGLALLSFVLAVIALIVLLAYIIAAFMSPYIHASLFTFVYFAAMITIVVGILGAGFAAADLMSHPKNEPSRKVLYLNLIILAIAFTLFIIKLV